MYVIYWNWFYKNGEIGVFLGIYACNDEKGSLLREGLAECSGRACHFKIRHNCRYS